jgi:hypothetical protein
VFRRLYADHCAAAWSVVSSSDVQAGCQAVEIEFASQFGQLTRISRSSVVRREILATRTPLYMSLKTNVTCLFCLLRGTDDMLPCGHAICNICERRFGERARGAEYHFGVTSCIICRESFAFTVRILPPTKRPTILVLDGGGIRGVISLGYLRALEERQGNRSLRELFDLTLATSVGK